MFTANLQTLAQYYPDTAVEVSKGGGWSVNPFALVLTVIVVVSLWFIFKKAKRPGWAALIPIYSTLVMLWVIKRPWWWLLLMFIPIVNIVVYIIVQYELAKAFKKGWGMALLLVLLPFIGYPVLAFGDAKYKKK